MIVVKNIPDLGGKLKFDVSPVKFEQLISLPARPLAAGPQSDRKRKILHQSQVWLATTQLIELTG
jgi:hypothetical protein